MHSQMRTRVEEIPAPDERKVDGMRWLSWQRYGNIKIRCLKNASQLTARMAVDCGAFLRCDIFTLIWANSECEMVQSIVPDKKSFFESDDGSEPNGIPGVRRILFKLLGRLADFLRRHSIKEFPLPTCVVEFSRMTAATKRSASTTPKCFIRQFIPLFIILLYGETYHASSGSVANSIGATGLIRSVLYLSSRLSAEMK